MPSISYYSNLINARIDGLDLPATPVGLYQPIAYMLGGGGKRIRPVLTCATAESFGLDCNGVMNQALAIEMFHNFTLLHDDVMDNADVRHNRPTVHKKWNEATAILSGDTMLTLASILMARGTGDKIESILTLFNKTAVEIYEGQQLDMNMESVPNPTVDEYLNMIRLKTAVLLGCACSLGAIMAGASDKDVDLMYDYGRLMGLAFQLRDDYLDTFGNEVTFGKAIGGDILNDKKTWLQVETMQMVPQRLIDLRTTLHGDEKIEAIRQLYVECGVDKKCCQLIEQYTRQAVSALDSVNFVNHEFKDFFTHFALNAINRNS